MQDFEVDGDAYSSSIGFDATKRGGIVVTVGVFVNRSQEALLLEDLYRELNTHDYLPFRTKSRDLSLPTDAVIDVAHSCRGTIGVCIHRDGNVKLPYTEAVHSAILLDEMNISTNKTIVIVDGDASRADRLYHAASGVEVVSPPVVSCVNSEMYYPHLLLADLVAGEVADKIQSKQPVPFSADDLVSVDTTTGTRDGAWGKGYSAAARSKGSTPNPTFEQRFGYSPRARISCWFQGIFGSDQVEPPETDSVAPVVGRLKSISCTDVANWIAEQQ